jgi:hypothetical protein
MFRPVDWAIFAVLVIGFVVGVHGLATGSIAI